jgi:hypothetical protein
LSVFQIDSKQIYRVEPFLQLDWLEHGFGTRHTVDWPPAERLVSLKQIHSDIIITAKPNATGRLGDGDALISNQPGLMLGVRTADCEPILLVDTKQRAIAAVHAGWRGTADEILPKVVQRMMLEFDSDPADILAAIGPAIGECCYEVGAEVARRFCKFFPERSDLETKTRIGLTETNRRQLTTAGLIDTNIFTGAPCTFCSHNFHSFRRDTSDGRMYSAIQIL